MKNRLKRWLYNWRWVLPVAGGVLITRLIFRFDLDDKGSIIGSTWAAALGVSFFLQQQKLAETTLFRELFTQFNARYEKLHPHLESFLVEQTDPTPQQLRIITDYFNLCAEEYLFYSEGYIHREVWRSWCRGMLQYFTKKPFNSIWLHEMGTGSYYGLSESVIKRGAA